jgi:hypothetical protein
MHYLLLVKENERYLSDVRFEVVTAETVHVAVWWVLASCSLVEVY